MGSSLSSLRSGSAPPRQAVGGSRARFSVRCDQVTPELVRHVERTRRERRLIRVDVDCRTAPFDDAAVDALVAAAGVNKLVLDL